MALTSDASSVREDNGGRKGDAARAAWVHVLRRLGKIGKAHVQPPQSQAQSSLFRLPPEVRELVWQHVLEPDADSTGGHIHVYDELIAGCTYDHAHHPKPPSRHRTALLRACKTIHTEAADYLWDQTHFTLVLFPGLARPRAAVKQLYSMGTLSNWSHGFNRMRHATIVVQPGVEPHVAKFRQRVAKFLAALSQGRNLLTLQLVFNLHKDMADPQAAKQIIDSFGTLDHTPSVSAPRVKLWGRPLRFDVDQSLDQLAQTLAKSDSVQHAQDIFRVNQDMCSARGYYGQAYLSQHSQPLTQKEEKVFTAFVYIMLGAGLICAPVTVPAYLHYVRARRQQKGEA